MKIATWNVNSLRVRMPQVLDWLAQEAPDVLALQETKVEDDQFPAVELEQLGYQVCYSGQKTYNGVAILSRQDMTDAVTDPPALNDPQRRILAVTIGDLRLVNLYVPNGSEVGSDKYAYKLEWLLRIRNWLEGERVRYPRMVVMGDFNIAPDDRDVHDPDLWRGKVLCSDAEREALRALLNVGVKDAYRAFEQDPGSFSWWDYRMNGFRRNLGLRIDLILMSEPLLAQCERCWIDKAPRALERPSDHAPVAALLT